MAFRLGDLEGRAGSLSQSNVEENVVDVDSFGSEVFRGTTAARPEPGVGAYVTIAPTVWILVESAAGFGHEPDGGAYVAFACPG